MQLSVKTSSRWLASLAVSAVGVFDGFSCERWVKGNIPSVKLKAEKIFEFWSDSEVILPKCKANDDNIIYQNMLTIFATDMIYFPIFTAKSLDYFFF